MPRYAMAMWGLVVLLLLSGVVGAVVRGRNNMPNWGSLSTSARYVWENHHTQPDTKMFGYLPAATFLLWPFMVWAPQPLGLYAYVFSNLLAGFLTLWVVYRWWLEREEQSWTYAFPAVLICGNFQHAIQANQLTMWTLLLVVTGLALVYRGRGLTGGAALGIAGLIKSMPFLLAVMLVLHRKWRALFGMGLAVLLIDVIPSIAFFGLPGAIDEHQAWMQRARWHSNTAQIEQPLLIGPFRHASNFSYSGVLARWLRGLPDVPKMRVISGKPPPDVLREATANLPADEVLLWSPIQPNDVPWKIQDMPIGDVPRFHLATLSARTVRWIWGSTLGAGFVALVWATWRLGRDKPLAWQPAAACWLLAMFFLSPMTRHYYLALAFPAIVVIWRTVRRDRALRAGAWTVCSVLAQLTLVAWLVGVFCLGWDVGRWYGLHLVILATLATATGWSWCRSWALSRPKPTSL